MANWAAGTYTIAAGTTGTSTGSNTSNTLNCGSANFPTGAFTLANFFVRIISGPGAGQFMQIASNTATQLTLVGTWTTIPTNTSIYEVVWYIQNGDHITGLISLQSNIIMEVQPSANIYFDGNYYIYVPTGTTGIIYRLGFSATTYPWWQANNRTVQGKQSFWTQAPIYFANTLTGAITFQWHKITDCTTGYSFALNNAAMGSASNFGPIWFENIGAFGGPIAGVQTQNTTIQGLFIRNSSGLHSIATSTSAFSLYIQNFWFEKCTIGSIVQTTSVNVNVNMFVQNCVAKASWGGMYGGVASGKTWYIADLYVDPTGVGATLNYVGYNPTGTAGAYHVKKVVSTSGNFISGGSTAGTTASMDSQYNDCVGTSTGSALAIAPTTTSFGTITSDNDYLAGTHNASSTNVDTTMATTSTASPTQYQNLTSARTNAKSVRNKPLTVNNVVAGTPTGSAVTITFDCANGTVAGPGNTTVNADSASGQTTLNVLSTTGFVAGDTIEVAYGTARYEKCTIQSIGSGTLIMTSNLLFTHTATQADLVTQILRHTGLPFIQYGTASGVYNMSTALPNQNDWGLFYTGFLTQFNGETYAFKQVGHSVNLTGLEASTTYYYTPYVYNPLGEVCVGTEQTFTTGVATGYTDPGVTNVLSGVSYQYANATETGTLVEPTAAQVQTGVAFGPSSSLTGTYNGSDRWSDPGVSNVLNGVSYKANSLTNNETGTLVEPTTAQVKIGTAFGPSSSQTGTYDGSDRWSILPPSVVVAGFNYQSNSLTNNETGTLAFPTAAQNAAAVWDEPKASHTTAGTFGVNLDAKVSSTNTTAHFDTVVGTPATTVSGDIAVVKADVLAIPTNPLLTTDSRLNDLDAPISSRASQTSVNAIPTNPLLTTDSRLNDLDAPISSRSTQTSVNAIPTNPLLTTDSRVSNLDATVSSRATQTSVDALPTAEETAMAVWDEPIASHSTAGTTGKTLKDAKNAAVAGL